MIVTKVSLLKKNISVLIHFEDGTFKVVPWESGLKVQRKNTKYGGLDTGVIIAKNVEVGDKILSCDENCEIPNPDVHKNRK